MNPRIHSSLRSNSGSVEKSHMPEASPGAPACASGFSQESPRATSGGSRFDQPLGQWYQLDAASTPPSTVMSAPVTYDDRSEARKATQAATSSGRPIRPSGTVTALLVVSSGVSRSAGNAPTATPFGVGIWSGATQLTRIPSPASSSARQRENCATAAFIAA